MGLLFGIFKLFIILFIISLVIVAVTLYRGVRFFKKMTGQGGSRRQQSQQRTTSYRTTQTSDGITIMDSRSSSEANKKIFAPDEGEYVDFDEIK